jgi:hypothetical protein
LGSNITEAGGLSPPPKNTVILSKENTFFLFKTRSHQGWIQDFKLGGAHLKTLRRAEGGGKFFGVFRLKNHDFTTGSAPDMIYCSGQYNNPILLYGNKYFPINFNDK